MHLLGSGRWPSTSGSYPWPRRGKPDSRGPGYRTMSAPMQPGPPPGTPRRRRPRHPAQVVAAAFATGILAGTVLLVLPAARAGPEAAPLQVAAFTATSAVCVTGLTVTDTATYWSAFGQWPSWCSSSRRPRLHCLASLLVLAMSRRLACASVLLARPRSTSAARRTRRCCWPWPRSASSSSCWRPPSSPGACARLRGAVRRAPGSGCSTRCRRSTRRLRALHRQPVRFVGRRLGEPVTDRHPAVIAAARFPVLIELVRAPSCRPLVAAHQRPLP